jgi:dTDP-4-dehydrorhamnose 3,5-epimerase
MINFKKLSITEVLLIEPKIFNDERGFFFESYNQKEFEEAIERKVTFVQDNQSFSNYGVLRGLHSQKQPHEQAKLIRVIEGKIFDVAVDIRKNSRTYGQWVGEILSSKNNKMLWIPEGFAHGFLVLSDFAHVLYKTNNYYNRYSETCIRWDDPQINIKWPNVENKIISEKDQKGILI